MPRPFLLALLLPAAACHSVSPAPSPHAIYPELVAARAVLDAGAQDGVWSARAQINVGEPPRGKRSKPVGVRFANGETIEVARHPCPEWGCAAGPGEVILTLTRDDYPLADPWGQHYRFHVREHRGPASCAAAAAGGTQAESTRRCATGYAKVWVVVVGDSAGTVRVVAGPWPAVE